MMAFVPRKGNVQKGMAKVDNGDNKGKKESSEKEDNVVKEDDNEQYAMKNQTIKISEHNQTRFRHLFGDNDNDDEDNDMVNQVTDTTNNENANESESESENQKEPSSVTMFMKDLIGSDDFNKICNDTLSSIDNNIITDNNNNIIQEQLQQNENYPNEFNQVYSLVKDIPQCDNDNNTNEDNDNIQNDYQDEDPEHNATPIDELLQSYSDTSISKAKKLSEIQNDLSQLVSQLYSSYDKDKSTHILSLYDKAQPNLSEKDSKIINDEILKLCNNDQDKYCNFLDLFYKIIYHKYLLSNQII